MLSVFLIIENNLLSLYFVFITYVGYLFLTIPASILIEKRINGKVKLLKKD